MQFQTDYIVKWEFSSDYPCISISRLREDGGKIVCDVLETIYENCGDLSLRQLIDEHEIKQAVKARGNNEDVSSADVAPVRHGRWEKPTKLYPFWDWKCSECGCEEYRQADSKGQYRQMAYCPNCGAKMDGEAWEDAT